MDIIKAQQSYKLLKRLDSLNTKYKYLSICESKGYDISLFPIDINKPVVVLVDKIEYERIDLTLYKKHIFTSLKNIILIEIDEIKNELNKL